MNTIKLASVPRQAWRNGGGTTQEMLAWPHVDEWALRLSVAQIDRSGPFSAYPGIQRSFCVLKGLGVRLRWPLGDRVVKASDEALDFDGGDPPDCTLLEGPTVDLNLMVRAAAGRGSLTRASPGHAWHSTAPWRAVYTVEAATLRRPCAPATHLPADSLSWCTEAVVEDWLLDVAGTGAGSAWWIEFHPTPHRPTP